MPETTSPATSTPPAAPSSTEAPAAVASQPSPTPTPAPAQPDPAPAPAPTAASIPGSSPGTPAPTPTPRPEGVPESFWDAEKGQLKTNDWAQSYEQLRAFKAEADAKKAALPAQPDLYKAELPASFKLPDDVKAILEKQNGALEIDGNSPLFKAAREFAFKYGLPQDAVNDMVGFEAARHIELLRAQADFNRKRDEALGPNVEARKSARDAFLRASAADWFGVEEGKTIGDLMVSMPVDSPHFRWFEKAAEALSKQGVRNYSALGREVTEGRTDGRPDNWDSMSSVDKRHWELTNRSKAA